MIETILLAGLAGVMIPFGGWIAAFEHIRKDWLRNELRHSVMAFSGGILLSAVVLVLIPQGDAALGGAAVVFWITGGAVTMAVIDERMTRSGSPRAQLMAMLADFIPETVALGALIASGTGPALLLALMIGLQNLPEGFNAFREQNDRGIAPRRILRRFVAMGLLGPAAALTGFLFLSDQPQVTGAMMLGASGAILYLIFQDIVPQAKLSNRHGPPLAAVGGFVLGLLGHMLIG